MLNSSLEVWAMILLFLAGSSGALLGSILPMSPGAPVVLDLFLAGTNFLIAILLWRLKDYVMLWGLKVMWVFAIVEVSVLVANSDTTSGVLADSFAYIWLCVYAAYYFSFDSPLLYAGTISLGFGVGLVVADVSNAVIAWMLLSGTVWAISIALSTSLKRLNDLAETDQLTGLLNRLGFAKAASRVRALSERTGTTLVLAVVDVDGFKEINDSCGHAAGDRVLVELSRSWKAQLREADLVSRHGGDEFVLLLAAPLDEAKETLFRIRGNSELAWSAGLARWEVGESLDDCLLRADRALYEAKLDSETKEIVADDRFQERNHT